MTATPTISRSTMITKFVLFSAVLCVGCSADPPLADLTTPPPSPDLSPPPLDFTLIAPEIRRLHGEDRLLTLLYPDRVECFRVSKVGNSGSPVVDQAASDYQVISNGPDLTAAHIDHLRPLFIDMRGYNVLRRQERKRYYPGEMRVVKRGCGWNPGVVLRFYRGDTSVAVVLCFACNEWAFEADGQRYRSAGFSENTKTGGLQPALRSLMIKLFPDDSVVQSIAY